MDTKIIMAIVAVMAVVGIGYWAMMGSKNTMVADSNTTMQASPAMQSSPMAMGSASSDGVMVGGAMMTPQKDIVDNAVNSKDHTTVVAAVKAAGLVETLKGEGPFTVFAPTNAAFEKLPAGTVETLLKPENKTQLTGVLTYHVVPGAYKAADLKDGMSLKTVNGQMLTLSQKDGKWWINNSAMVTIGDVISSNGVTHVIDMVLLPK